MSSIIFWFKILPFILLLTFTEFYSQPDKVLKGSNLPVDKTPGTFQAADPIPSFRYEFTASAVNGKIYLVGGIDLPSVWFPTSLVEVYDPVKNLWSPGTNYPRRIHHTSSATCEGKIYVVGGNGRRIFSTSDVYSYDPLKDVWEKKANLPQARGALASVCLNGKVYTVGGGLNKKALAELDEYDPKTDTWKIKTPMPTAREHLAAVAADGKIYVFGGYPDERSNSLPNNEVYDPKTDKWETKAPIPYPVTGFSAVYHDGSIFLFGGEQGWAVSKEVLEYKIAENRWIRKADLPVARYGFAAVVVNNSIHILGGNDVLMGYKFLNDHYVFLP